MGRVIKTAVLRLLDQENDWSVFLYYSVAKVLLAANADVEIANFEGNTPLLRYSTVIPKYKSSVAYPGSGAYLTPGSGIRVRFSPDPGPRNPIPDPKPIFLRA
jgi:hypothetical protein